MATKTMYATGALKYGTRRLMAGDPVEMNASHQRLYLALGKVTDKKPRAARATAPEPAPAETETPAPKRKRTTRKRTAKK